MISWYASDQEHQEIRIRVAKLGIPRQEWFSRIVKEALAEDLEEQQQRLVPITMPEQDVIDRAIDTLKQIAIEALIRFDGSYKNLMSELKRQGATPQTYQEVNGAIKKVMQSTRGEVRDRKNPDEMNCWSEGYTLTKKMLNDIQFAAKTAKSAFIKPKKKWGL